MEPAFWLNRWDSNQIGFHRPDVNPRLVAHRDVLAPAAGKRLFVPLCGKSHDLMWLAEQGFDVVGVELSERAVSAFFAEHGLEPTVSQEGALLVHRAPRLTLYCGDFFALTPGQLGEVAGFYDRAALVALPPALRPRYAAHLTALVPPEAVGLLVSFEYPQNQMSGPPFSVPEEEVRREYGAAFEIELRASYDVLDEEARFRAAGVRALHERVYRLERR